MFLFNFDCSCLFDNFCDGVMSSFKVMTKKKK